MNDAGKSGKHMSPEVVARTCAFIKIINPSFIMISGGEPTEHPDFENVVHAIMKATGYSSFITIASNGLFVTDPDKFEMMKRIARCDPVVLIQVTRGKPFYPRDDVIVANEQKLKSIGSKVSIVDINDSIAITGSLFPAGRALVNHRELIGRGKPACSNLYLLPRQVDLVDLSDLVQTLEEMTRTSFCKPSIDPDGNIHAGECISQCEIIGNVNDSPRTLLDRLKTGKPCNRCGLVKNLPDAAARLFF
jgi:hypothetical protein